MENLTLAERLILAGLFVLLAAGTLTRMWRQDREPAAATVPPGAAETANPDPPGPDSAAAE